MTERFEITSILQRAFVNDPATFGEMVPGTDADPGVYMESVHYLMKLVSGAPNIRPAWFFDTAEQGEGLNDIGTHLVDLVQWTLFPDTGHRLSEGRPGRRRAALADHYLAAGFPAGHEGAALSRPAWVRPSKGTTLEYYCNTLVAYTLRGIHTKLNVIWDWEPPAGSGDTHFAFYRGTRARVEIRQGQADRFRPELYVIPAAAPTRRRCSRRSRQRSRPSQDRYPGVTVEDRGAEIHIAIPDAFRVGHEAHFAQVTANFLDYMRNRSALPAWERPNMLAKY